MKFDPRVPKKKKTNLCIDMINIYIYIYIMRHCILKLFIKIKKSKNQPAINSNMEYRKSQQGTVSKEIEKIAYIYIYISVSTIDKRFFNFLPLEKVVSKISKIREFCRYRRKLPCNRMRNHWLEETRWQMIREFWIFMGFYLWHWQHKARAMVMLCWHEFWWTHAYFFFHQ